jgi:hypothetical protein
MKRNVIIVVAFLVVMGFSSISLFAEEEEPKHQSFLLTEVVIHKYKAAEYEKLSEEMVALYAEHKSTYPWYEFVTDDLNYMYSIPIMDYADIDAMDKEDNEIWKKIGEEKGKQIEERWADIIKCSQTWITTHREDLSYQPESPRLEAKKANFRHIVNYYIKVGSTNEFVEVLIKLKDLCKSKNVADVYNVYTGDIGTEWPMYSVIFHAESAADFHAIDEKNMELLGEEAKILLKKLFTLIRKRDVRTAWLRPDLSYFPKKEEVKE